jgi:hypothetical protein
VLLEDGEDVLEEIELLVAGARPEIVAIDDERFLGRLASLVDDGHAAFFAEGWIGQDDLIFAVFAGQCVLGHHRQLGVRVPTICDGSIDRKLEAGIHEKKDAAELVLDGHLLGETPKEVNLHELLSIAKNEFNMVKTIDEPDSELDWPRLRAALGKAFSKWRVGLHEPEKETLVANFPLWRRHFLRLNNEKQRAP